MGDTCQVATLRKPLEKEVLEPRPSSVTDVAARHPLSSMPHCIGEEYRIGNLDIWVIPEYAQTVLGVDPAVLQQQLEDNYPVRGAGDAIEWASMSASRGRGSRRSSPSSTPARSARPTYAKRGGRRACGLRVGPSAIDPRPVAVRDWLAMRVAAARVRRAGGASRDGMGLRGGECTQTEM